VTKKPQCALMEGECPKGCRFGFFGPCLRRQTMRRRPTLAQVVLVRGLATLVILALMLAVGAWLWSL